MVTSRIWFTAAQKAELWERWKEGQSLSSISRALVRRSKGGVRRIVSLHGGIAPPARRRSALALRLEEREEISRGIAAGRSLRSIAWLLGRSPSTLSREISRNGGAQANRAAPTSVCSIGMGRDYVHTRLPAPAKVSFLWTTRSYQK
jgi:DNA-binding CsgD family transcriptional regulator